MNILNSTFKVTILLDQSLVSTEAFRSYKGNWGMFFHQQNKEKLQQNFKFSVS